MKSSRSNEVVSENIGLSKRMCFSCTIESAISLGPVAAAAFDHADRKTVQRNIENVAAGPAKPSGHAAEFVMLLQQKNTMPGAGQRVGAGQPGQSAANDDAIVFVGDALKKIAGHDAASARQDVEMRLGLVSLKHLLATWMPLVSVPTMPTKPWSAPQINRFSRWVFASYRFCGAPYTAPFRGR